MENANSLGWMNKEYKSCHSWLTVKVTTLFMPDFFFFYIFDDMYLSQEDKSIMPSIRGGKLVFEEALL